MIELRNFRPDDFAAMFDIVADYRVAEMVGSWPWPAEPAFTKMRLATPEAQAGKVQAICVNGELAGNIGLVRGEIGYLLGRHFWGQGVATRAVAMMLARGFRAQDLAEVRAGVWADNPASARVLIKNGFELTGHDSDFGKARNCESPINRYRLTRETWENASK